MSSVFQQIGSSQHWDEQVALLEQICVSEQMAKQLNIHKNGETIKMLLANPRSKVITTTIDFLIDLFEKYGPVLHSFALQLLESDNPFRLINSSNKVISSSAHELLKAIILQCPHSKFYSILAAEFSSSKNPQVREYITSYLIVLADTIEIPAKLMFLLRKWKQEPKGRVRENVNILCNLAERGKLHGVKEEDSWENKENVDLGKKMNSESKVQRSASEVSQSHMIIDSFIDISSVREEAEISIGFLISKIGSNESWNIKHMAIQELVSEAAQCRITPVYLRDTIRVLVSLLNEKRGKLSQSVAEALHRLLIERDLVQGIISEFSVAAMEKAVRDESIAGLIIPRIITFDPTHYIVQACQLCFDLKSIKQKVILLDLLVEAICSYSIPPHKVSTVVKILSQLLPKYPHHKSIYLPCMAIISHFKVSHPDELLSCLLCLGNSTLSQVVAIAEEIDPSLKNGILSYMHGLKEGFRKMEVKNKDYGIEMPQLLLCFEAVRNEEEDCISWLAETVFQLLPVLQPSHFNQLIKLSQQIVSEPILLELELLLQELCKAHSHAYLCGLFISIQSCSSNAIESQYIISYLNKVYFILAHSPQLMEPSHSEKLINLFRYSRSPKIRMLSIRILGTMPHEFVSPVTNMKEKKLISMQMSHKSRVIGEAGLTHI